MEHRHNTFTPFRATILVNKINYDITVSNNDIIVLLIFPLVLLDDSVAIEESLVCHLLHIGCWLGGLQ